MDAHQDHKGKTAHGRPFRISNGVLILDAWKNRPMEVRRILPYHDHKLYLNLIDGRGKEPHLFPVHRWHLLSSVKQGKTYTEILAATCDDGIAVIARWTLVDSKWKVDAMDSEGCKWETITDWSDETVVTQTPPRVYDDNPSYGV